MAAHLGEEDTAREYRALFSKGRAWVDKHLFNGAYYHQLIDLKDKSVAERFAAPEYWNDEHGELKYQIGEGSEIDQVVAQWHANLYGLGDIFSRRQVRKALKSLYKNNFRTSMREHFNACRIYALNDEAGLVVCEWPEGAYRPATPLPYAGETQNGYEWAACIQMLQAGFVKEGMRCVEAIRSRYDGEKRNPWNEFECGSNYARSMASYALLNAFSGFSFDMTRGMIGFDPIRTREGCFQCFWSLDTGWGTFSVTPQRVELRLLYGYLNLKMLRMPFLAGLALGISLGGTAVGFEQRQEAITLAQPVHIDTSESLRVKIVRKRRSLRMKGES